MQSTFGTENSEQNPKSPNEESYFNSLFNSQTKTATNYSFRSNAHNLTVQKQDKLALNPFDDEQFLSVIHRRQISHRSVGNLVISTFHVQYVYVVAT